MYEEDRIAQAIEELEYLANGEGKWHRMYRHAVIGYGVEDE